MGQARSPMTDFFLYRLLLCFNGFCKGRKNFVLTPHYAKKKLRAMPHSAELRLRAMPHCAEFLKKFGIFLKLFLQQLLNKVLYIEKLSLGYFRRDLLNITISDPELLILLNLLGIIVHTLQNPIRKIWKIGSEVVKKSPEWVRLSPFLGQQP
jgi:hypothetical protein